MTVDTIWHICRPLLSHFLEARLSPCLEADCNTLSGSQTIRHIYRLCCSTSWKPNCSDVQTGMPFHMVHLSWRICYGRGSWSHTVAHSWAVCCVTEYHQRLFYRASICSKLGGAGTCLKANIASICCQDETSKGNPLPSKVHVTQKPKQPRVSSGRVRQRYQSWPYSDALRCHARCHNKIQHPGLQAEEAS